MKYYLSIKPILALIFIVSTTMFACSQHSSKMSEASRKLNSDPTNSSDITGIGSLPFYFNYESDTLLGRIFMSSGNNNPTVIFLHGNPGFEKNEDIGQMLRRGGFNSVFFSYPGTWGNAGIFNYESATKSSLALINYLKKNHYRYRIDSTNLFIAGHSMGADIGMVIARNVKGVICIDPWNGYNWLSSINEQERNNYIKLLDKRSNIHLVSGAAFVSNILSNPNNNLQKYTSDSRLKIYYIFSNKTAESKFKLNQINLQPGNSVILNAIDHSFSDKRILLGETIYEWITRSLEQ